jgi:hypothetical protein
MQMERYQHRLEGFTVHSNFRFGQALNLPNGVSIASFGLFQLFLTICGKKTCIFAQKMLSLRRNCAV